MHNTLKTPSKSLFNRQFKEKRLMLKYIIKEVEKGTGLSVLELKRNYPEDYIFAIALKHITTTKKALCAALNIPIEGACRYKRSLEKDGHLVQSFEKVYCPYTKHLAHLISTDPKEFEGLLRIDINQLNLFEPCK
jgi:hypothetical protein